MPASLALFRTLCYDPFPDAERFAALMLASPHGLQLTLPPATHPTGQPSTSVRRWRSPNAMLEYGDNPAAPGRMSRSCLLATRISDTDKDLAVASFSLDLALPPTQLAELDWQKDGTQSMCWVTNGHNGQPLIVTLMLMKIPTQVSHPASYPPEVPDMLAAMVVAKPTPGPDGKPKGCT